jgi:hypothetical protein
MSEDSGPLPSPGQPAVAPPAWMGRLASVFVLIALAALVIVPLLVQRRVDEVRGRVEEVADPARTLVRRIQFDLAREATALLLVSTGSTQAAEDYREARRDELAQFPQLQAYAESLGGEVLREFRRFQGLAQQWQARVSLDRAVSEPAYAVALLANAGETLELAGQGFDAGNRLDEALVREAQRNREMIRRVERSGLRITLALGALAMLAAATVMWLSWRVRQLATVAASRRSAR